MAGRKTNTQPVEKALLPGEQVARMKLGEIGFTGLNVFDGVSDAEIKKELNHPNSVFTYKEMSYHPSVSAPLSLYTNLISKATFRVIPVKDASAEEKKQAELVQEMLNDMETPLEDVVIDAMSMSVHGFCVMEKVYRRRNKESGSMYTDNLIAPKKLALRSQETIEKFIFSDDGNEVVAVKQSLTRLKDPFGRFKKRTTTDVLIPRKKFLLFNTGRTRSNPYGVSPLRDVYLPWRYLTAVEELEASGVAKDLQGLPVLSIPAQYMAADASDDQKVVYEQFKNIIRNIQMNSQSGVVLPSEVNPDTKTPLFKLELLSTEGGKKAFDTTKIKEYYRNLIFIGLSADILLMGTTTTGSFALSESKGSLTVATVEQYLRRIVQVLNEDLIRQIYEMNGWNPARRARIDYEEFDVIDLESLSKFYQRVASVGLIEKDRPVLNAVRTAIGLDPKPDDEPVDPMLLSPETSKAGDAMSTPFEGGRTSAGDGNDNDNNADNVG